jgi:hypothetical protein
LPFGNLRGFAEAAKQLLSDADWDEVFAAWGAESISVFVTPCPQPPPKAVAPPAAPPCPAAPAEEPRLCVVSDVFYPSFVSSFFFGEQPATVFAYYPCSSDTDEFIARDALRKARIARGLGELKTDVATAIVGARVAVIISLGGVGEFIDAVDSTANFVANPTWSAFLPIAGSVVLKLSRGISKRWPGHHPFPKYLGGAPDQTLKKIPRKLHERFHAALDKWKGGRYARSKGSSYFEKLDKWEIIQDLREFYTKAEAGIFKKYLPDFEQAVIESGFGS